MTINELKKTIAWYTYNGIEVTILYTKDLKTELKGVEEIDSDLYYSIVSLEELAKKNIPLCLINYTSTIDDWDGYVEGHGEEIIYADIVNADCTYRLITGYVTKDYYYSDLLERNLMTDTNRRYYWTSDLHDFIDECVERLSDYCDLDSTIQYLQSTWDDICNKYPLEKTCYTEYPTFEEIWNKYDFDRYIEVDED